jgi:hypothetical protein
MMLLGLGLAQYVYGRLSWARPIWTCSVLRSKIIWVMICYELKTLNSWISGWYLVWKLFLSRFKFVRELLGTDRGDSPERDTPKRPRRKVRTDWCLKTFQGQVCDMANKMWAMYASGDEFDKGGVQQRCSCHMKLELLQHFSALDVRWSDICGPSLEHSLCEFIVKSAIRLITIHFNW